LVAARLCPVTGVGERSRCVRDLNWLRTEERPARMR
jgi:hypothetical protein